MKHLLPRTGRCAKAALISLAMYGVFVERGACKGGRDDIMVAPKQTIASASQRAAEAMEKLDFVKARTVVFEILKEDLDEKTRFGIMQSFAKKFNDRALEEIRKEVFLVGMSPESFAGLERKNLRRFGYMKTLAYGLALFGNRGFRAAVDIVESAGKPQFQLIATDTYSLLHGITTTAVYMIQNNGLLDEDASLRLLSERITKKDQPLGTAEKEILIRWSIRIKPVSACSLSTALAGDREATELVDLHLRNELHGQVPCATGGD